uniref:Uncharacterized protein n=1 Tax=Scophthalmus maximus TaxID=52904 RepID=A0A8D2ZPS5_SCOMX
MELPFTDFELTFIIVAFVVFSLFSMASIFIQPVRSCVQMRKVCSSLYHIRAGKYQLFKCCELCSCSLSEKDVDEAKASRPLNRRQRVITKQAGQRP